MWPTSFKKILKPFWSITVVYFKDHCETYNRCLSFWVLKYKKLLPWVLLTGWLALVIGFAVGLLLMLVKGRRCAQDLGWQEQRIQHRVWASARRDELVLRVNRGDLSRNINYNSVWLKKQLENMNQNYVFSQSCHVARCLYGYRLNL